jgi:acyl-CoA reductase-like NAD-dependent aldehyde dehydrogenase/FAD/FMN-containing dehydrogenase
VSSVEERENVYAREPLAAALIDVVGDDAFSDNPADRAFLSQDIWAKGDIAAFTVSPGNTQELSAVARIAHEHGVALNPRGGGMSYTQGFTPDREHVGVLDISRMDRILEINEKDRYVTVEAGCTWKALYEALKEKGLRTPFWGPLSGVSSTIGGGLSQNNAFFGAGVHGTTGDSVLSVTVVLADGTIIRTGTAGTKGGKPFFRYYGPDITGLFCGDAGALGYKAEITLRLAPLPEHEDWASFEFPSRDACAEAMRAIMSEHVACEVFGFDPNLQRVRMKRASMMADAKTLTNVIKGQGSLLKGLKEGAKVAFAGRSFMDKAAYSLHFVVEGRSEAGVKNDAARLKEIAAQHQGKEIENSIPKIIRANPFTPLNNVLGPEGERWVPIHGIVPTSEGPAAWAEIDTAFDAMRDELDRHNILTGYLVTNIGATAYLIEPVFIWPEEIYEIHERTVERDYLAGLKRHAPNPEATAAVEKARQAVLDVFSRRRAAHFQIGRTYPYKEGRLAETWALLEKIKHAVDESGVVNPGALGLLPADVGSEKKQIKVRNPRSGEYDYSFEPTSVSALKERAALLRAAQEGWRDLKLEERSAHMRRLADALRARVEEIGGALEIDTGRRRIAQLEAQGVAASIEGWITAAPALLPEGWTPGRTRPEIKHAPQFAPLGLIGVISPWNFPLTLSMIDAIPALLAGCAVMIKPSEVTPRFVDPFALAIDEAGLSDILGIVRGAGDVGAALIGEADAVCFTGSVATGRKVAAAAAEKMIPAFLELGGKDPLIVTADADLEKASDAALRGSVLATGQACQSIERIYVDHSVYDQFLNLLVRKAETVRINYPDIKSGEIGPIIFDRQAETLHAHIEDAKSKGARVLTGGEIETHGGGLWLRPTVIAHVSHTMTVMRDETFGPILPVMKFTTNDEAVGLANDTAFGLSAAVFAGSLDDAEAIGRRINAGAISLNDAALTSQFHEAEKQSFGLSGLGPSRMGAAGFQRFFRRKALIANTGAPLPISAFAEDMDH